MIKSIYSQDHSIFILRHIESLGGRRSVRRFEIFGIDRKLEAYFTFLWNISYKSVIYRLISGGSIQPSPKWNPWEYSARGLLSRLYD